MTGNEMGGCSCGTKGKSMEKILIRKGGKAKQSFPAFVFAKPTPRHHGG